MLRPRHAFPMLALIATLAASPAMAAVDTAAVVNNYADIVHANYEDALIKAKALQTAVEGLIAQPSKESLEVARQAWLAAREPYGQTEAFRFYGGPIDDAKDVEGRLNSWPLDEAYIDAVKGKPNSGLINNAKAPLNIERLIKLNAKGGEANVSTGYHAIEFLLWGQDFNPKGAGDRSYTDFVDGQGKNADRRRQYLKLVTDQVVADLDYLAGQWKADADNYRSAFLKDKPEANLRKMLTGMAILSSAELAGERMQVALDNQDQEDEHSCFSDNTHRDIVNNALGIRNVLMGEYKRVDGSVVKGPSIKDLVAEKNNALADKLALDFNASVQAAESIQAPFDQEIIGKKDAPGRKRVSATIGALKKQTQTLVEAARALGIKKLSVDLPK
ncbi:putative iron-regulated protein [Chitinivorax tropicus]|uniref:Putative iron-regulated protein n=1 Tax=Chitinivorax tropicus TaxID=714531 RepID=A0A840MLB1_9PROT|nr:imelysin family protein [Chitinivorax tropicus]MBB5017336.1 putative iron-regulated protein [Chitinivorax tropicus]